MLPGIGGITGFVGGSSSGGGGGPIFTSLPSGLTSPVAWYDAASLSGTDGSSVTTWADRMGSWNATKTNGTAPLLRHNSLNGLRQVEFSDIGTFGQLTMSSSLMSSATSGSYFCVVTLDNDPPPNSSNTGAVLDGFSTDTGGNRNSHLVYSDGNIYEHFGSVSRHTVGNPTPSFTTPRIYNVDCATNNYKARVDGSQIYTSSSVTVGFGSITKRLGWSDVGSCYLDGKIAEVLIFDSVLSQSNREKVEGYLAHKWFGAGASNNLDSGHPYKTTAP